MDKLRKKRKKDEIIKVIRDEEKKERERMAHIEVSRAFINICRVLTPRKRGRNWSTDMG